MVGQPDLQTDRIKKKGSQVADNGRLSNAICGCASKTSPVKTDFFPEKNYNKLKFGTITQDHILSYQKKPHVLDMELPPFLAFKVCLLVSKSLFIIQQPIQKL